MTAGRFSSADEEAHARHAPGRRALEDHRNRAPRNFRANHRGFWSLWVFLVLFGVTLFAEFLANDRPLFILS